MCEGGCQNSHMDFAIWDGGRDGPGDLMDEGGIEEVVYFLEKDVEGRQEGAKG